MVASACKLFRAFHTEAFPARRTSTRALSANASLAAYAADARCPHMRSIGDRAVREGLLPVLQVVYGRLRPKSLYWSLQPPPTRWVNCAAERGQLHVLQWLYAESGSASYKWDTMWQEVISRAGCAGHRHVLAWVIELGLAPWRDYCVWYRWELFGLAGSSGTGDSSTVEWAMRSGAPGPVELLSVRPAEKRLKMLRAMVQ